MKTAFLALLSVLLLSGCETYYRHDHPVARRDVVVYGARRPYRDGYYDDGYYARRSYRRDYGYYGDRPVSGVVTTRRTYYSEPTTRRVIVDY